MPAMEGNTRPAPALKLEDFNFEDETGYHKITPAQRDALNTYLQEHYNGHVASEYPPFLFIECKEVPPENERPFNIGGMIAVWREESDGTEMVAGLNVHPASGPEAKLPEELITMFSGIRRPPEVVPLYLASLVFPDCEAVSIFYDTVIIELPAQEEEVFAARLRTLPFSLYGCTFALMYSNGPLPRTKPEGDVDSINKSWNYTCDTTDYVTPEGQFNPGAMIASVNAANESIGKATAGVLVHRGAAKRLTCSHHLWTQHLEDERIFKGFKKTPQKTQDLFGQTTKEAQEVFALKQGESPGTIVGFARERVGDTDMVLAQLRSGTRFENIPLDSLIAVKMLVHSQNQAFGDRYEINSFTTGERQLTHLGERYRFSRNAARRRSSLRIPPEAEGILPEDNATHVAASQGIYAFNEPIMGHGPILTAGLSGTVLVRTFNAEQYRQGNVELEAVVRARGEVCGMMTIAYASSLYPPQNIGLGLAHYISFADAFDPLIAEGWDVCPVPYDRTQALLEQAAIEQAGARKQKEEESSSNGENGRS